MCVHMRTRTQWLIIPVTRSTLESSVKVESFEKLSQTSGPWYMHTSDRAHTQCSSKCCPEFKKIKPHLIIRNGVWMIRNVH